MKKLLFALGMAVALSACQMTPQKVAVTTLASVGTTANAAYEGYLQLVVQGNLPTNDVPKITHYYRDFQAGFGAACSAARFSTNTTFANPELMVLFDKLNNAVIIAKGGK